MTPDATTVIGYSAVLFSLICFMFLLFWIRDGRRSGYFWYGLPFASAGTAGLILAAPGLLPGVWGLRLGAFFAVFAYGAGWQASRVINGIKPKAVFAFFPCLAWLAFSTTYAMTGSLHAISAVTRVLMASGFNGLSAFEFWRRRDKHLPAGKMLFSVFATYSGIELLRSPFVWLLPAPLGAAATQLWSVVLFNLLVVVQALLVTAFMIALSRERLAAAHYRMALLDPLTGIGNRRALQDHIAGLPQVRGSGRGLAILVFDIDRFKAINDGHGHAFGDTIIVKAATVARKVLRGQDEVFRIGGEEFACVLADVSEQTALAVSERLRTAFERDAKKVDGISLDATISIGVAVSAGKQLDAGALLARADDALYEAKRGGRNRCVVAGDNPGGQSYVLAL